MLIEMIRRLLVALVWLFFGLFAVKGVSDDFADFSRLNDTARLTESVTLIVVAFVIHKVLNWIMLKTDSPFEDD